MKLHDDGKGNFSIEMDRKPSFLPYLANEQDLCFNNESTESNPPFKASLVFTMDEDGDGIYIGDVRDSKLKHIRSSDIVSNSIQGCSVRLSKTGKFQVLDRHGEMKDMSTNFTGKLLLPAWITAN